MAARVRVPRQARRGEAVVIRTLLEHASESGLRRNESGQAVPRNIVKRFVCRYNGDEVFRAELFPAIAANPFIEFSARAGESGDLVFRWEDESGRVFEERATISVID